jgi:hypothetical protein
MRGRGKRGRGGSAIFPAYFLLAVTKDRVHAFNLGSG